MLHWLLRRARSWRTWALLFLVGLCAVVGGRFLWAQHQLRAARAALERRAYSEARAHLDRYLSIWPKSPDAHLLAARCARGLGNFDEADRLLADSRQLGADRKATALEQALLDAERGTLGPADVKDLLDRVEEGDPQTAQILEALTAGCLYTNRPNEALICVERWLASAPGDSQALYLRGLAREGVRDLKRARDDFRDALRRDPDHGLARAHLAECLLNTGDPDEAAGHFLQLLEREPNDPTALLGLARCRRRQARPDEAQRLLDRLLAGDAVPVAALVERAGLCQERGAYREAVKWYREALKRDSSDPDACYALARCLRAQGRQKEAQTYEARAAEIEGDLHRLAQLTERMLTAPGDPELPYRAGMICLRNGQKGEARRWFRNALQRAPGHEGARRGLEQLSREQ